MFVHAQTFVVDHKLKPSRPLANRDVAMRPLGFLCRLAWTFLGDVYIRMRRYNAPRPCRAIPPLLGVAYSPNVGQIEDYELRLLGILGSTHSPGPTPMDIPG